VSGLFAVGGVWPSGGWIFIRLGRQILRLRRALIWLETDHPLWTPACARCCMASITRSWSNRTTPPPFVLCAFFFSFGFLIFCLNQSEQNTKDNNNNNNNNNTDLECTFLPLHLAGDQKEKTITITIRKQTYDQG
jgi:hypothetical protein